MKKIFIIELGMGSNSREEHLIIEGKKNIEELEKAILDYNSIDLDEMLDALFPMEGREGSNFTVNKLKELGDCLKDEYPKSTTAKELYTEECFDNFCKSLEYFDSIDFKPICNNTFYNHEEYYLLEADILKSFYISEKPIEEEDKKSEFSNEQFPNGVTLWDKRLKMESDDYTDGKPNSILRFHNGGNGDLYMSMSDEIFKRSSSFRLARSGGNSVRHHYPTLFFSKIYRELAKPIEARIEKALLRIGKDDFEFIDLIENTFLIKDYGYCPNALVFKDKKNQEFYIVPETEEDFRV